MGIRTFIAIGSLILATGHVQAQNKDTAVYHEPYRPQIHFSPKEKWMNDPNGMVYYKGVYHLFFQYYPKDIVWGPMHWGHAVSKDLIHWKQLPIALYPDSLGFIFSGSAVIDEHNTTGFGKNGKVPMVAIFTHHDPVGERAGKNNFQNESLAYSLDEGNTWTKYAGNPVLKNPGIRDFRDPKVMWYAPQNKWVMTLATKDRVTFFSSPNLKDWKKESEFGEKIGAHGGVWECPDLFQLKLEDKTYWVLVVNLNPGGPNKGSATQYFIGDFNGKVFTPESTSTKWIDYGPDEYAGITWSNTGSRKIFLGWMSNWMYAGNVPTKVWRNAMTIPRQLALKKVNGNILVASNPVKELDVIAGQANSLTNVNVKHGLALNQQMDKLPLQYALKFTTGQVKSYTITLANDEGNELLIGYDDKSKKYYIDRTKSGVVNFQPDFAGRFTAPRFAESTSSNLELIVDRSSVELFADGGLSVMTCIYFPNAPFNQLTIKSADGLIINNLKLTSLKSIW